MRALILAFFFVSGLCGLLYEVVWIRAAGTVIGNTTHAVGTVVGVFMGGLALGGWWGGRQADRRSGAALLRLYGLLEGGVAISALAVPLILVASEPLFRVLWSSMPLLYGVLRVLLVALILLVPTTLMGATLPVLARFLSSSIDLAGREAGRAYAINTLGGVLGTLAAGFWLVPELGLRATTLVAASLNLAIAAASLLLARGRAGDATPAAPAGPPPPGLPLLVAAGSGAAALLCEIAWTRSLVLALGSTVHAFTLILTAFILGLALGSAAAAFALPRLRRLPVALAVVQIAIGILVIALLPSLGELPLQVAPRMDGIQGNYDDLLRMQAGYIVAYVLLPTLFMGAVFPIAIRWASEAGRSVGRSVGAVYTANTLGSIVGSLAGSFALVPWLGLAGTVKFAATINLALAALLLFRASKAASLIPVAAAVLGWILLPAWDPKVMASGSFIYGAADARAAKTFQQGLKEYIDKDTELVGQHWDSYGLVTLHKQQNGVLTMRVNGKTDASTGPSDRANMLFVGHLPVLLADHPKRALCIGLGGGLTLAAMAKHPLEKIDCVEISPAVVRGAEAFKEANEAVLADKRVNLIVGDGRNALLFGRESYDVIVSQPSNLWVSGMANLFTRDFFAEGAARMAPGGVFGQWVHAYWLSPENFRDVLRTFFSVFPEGSVWEIFPGHDYILIGRKEASTLSSATLAERLAAGSILKDYVGAPPTQVETLLGHFVCSANDARRAAGDGPIITDDRCFIEYTAPRSLGRDTRGEVLAWLDPIRASSTIYPGLSPARREARRALADAVRLNRDDPERAMDALAKSPVPILRDPRTAVFLEFLEQGLLHKARERMAAMDVRGALAVLRRVPADSPVYFDSLMLSGEIALRLQRPEDARRAYQAARAADPKSVEAAAGYANALQIAQTYGDAADAWNAVIALRPDSAPAWRQRAVCLWRVNRADEARAACRKALEIDPKDRRAAELLAELK